MALGLTGCQKDPEEETTPKASGLSGQWVLSAFATKAVNVGGTDVDVYLDFHEDGTFVLYQMLGQGWYTKYSGTYTLEGTLLSGKYDGGKAWGSKYNVSKTSDTLVLTTENGKEEYTYKSTTIPASVLSMSH